MKIILTGGAGFIGSCFLWKLNKEGIEDIFVVDHLNERKEKNLKNKKFSDYFEKGEFLRLIEKDKIERVDAVIHLGACTSTVETNAEYIIENNYIYSKILAEWCLRNNIRFIYASSAATYGDGENGFSDEDEITLKLKPLNLYGISKHLFDLWVVSNKLTGKFVGLKFFNVYGPNEYHKGEMRSIVAKAYDEIVKTGKIKLFKSYRKNIKDGEQKRDFISVFDVINVIFFFMKNPTVSGIFNVGTGKARSFNEVANIIFSILGKTPLIEYVEMPERIKRQYQYFTEARVEKLRKAGYTENFSSLEEGIKSYIEFLRETKYL
ncbi:ADP-glyceromanno-heptose 6-epimerase [bacterium]|nr:ADP-glyceromanno-heptose 6-epimerase [bacterium]